MVKTKAAKTTNNNKLWLKPKRQQIQLKFKSKKKKKLRREMGFATTEEIFDRSVETKMLNRSHDERAKIILM